MQQLHFSIASIVSTCIISHRSQSLSIKINSITVKYLTTNLFFIYLFVAFHCYDYICVCVRVFSQHALSLFFLHRKNVTIKGKALWDIACSFTRL